jgi:hypothetical protein
LEKTRNTRDDRPRHVKIGFMRAGIRGDGNFRQPPLFHFFLEQCRAGAIASDNAESDVKALLELLQFH